MRKFPELEIRYTDRKSEVGWTEKEAVENALLGNPVTVFMYCLHALHVNVRDAFPPTILADIIDVGGARGGELGGVGDEYETVAEKEEEAEEEEEEKDDDNENVEDNAVTIEQISNWLQVNLCIIRPTYLCRSRRAPICAFVCLCERNRIENYGHISMEFLIVDVEFGTKRKRLAS